MRLQDNIGRKMQNTLYPNTQWIIALSVTDGEVDEQIVKMTGQRPEFSSIADNKPGVYHFGGSDSDWEPYVVKPTAVLPESIESLMKQFGCHEKQTRALVAAILEVIKEK